MEQIAIRLPKELLEVIDGFGAGRMSPPPRSATIRELLEEAIAARKKKGGD